MNDGLCQDCTHAKLRDKRRHLSVVYRKHELSVRLSDTSGSKTRSDEEINHGALPAGIFDADPVSAQTESAPHREPKAIFGSVDPASANKHRRFPMILFRLGLSCGTASSRRTVTADRSED
jgi:hypothetical protein